MNDRYYVFKQGQKQGPFSIEELLSEIEDGQCEYQDWCLRVGSTTCETVRDVLDWEDEHLLHEVGGGESLSPEPLGQAIGVEDDYDKGNDDNADVAGEIEIDDYELETVNLTQAGSDGSADNDGYFSEQEFDFNEPDAGIDCGGEDDFLQEPEDEWETSAPRPLPGNLPPADPMAILYSGRPSILSFPLSLLLTLLSLAAGIYFHRLYEWALSGGIALAVIFFVGAQLRCMRFQFFIRPRQIEVVHGLLLRNSRELCIEDIGAIHIRRRGLRGLLGLESVEFASTESPMIVAAFHNVRCARRIKSLIRRLQEVLESQRLPR